MVKYADIPTRLIPISRSQSTSLMASKSVRIRLPSESNTHPITLTPIPNIPAKKTRLELRIPADFLIRMLQREPQMAQPTARAAP